MSYELHLEETFCKLCRKPANLSLSHIIPRGLLRITKGQNCQLVAFEVSSGKIPYLDNVNWAEALLCVECEKWLNLRYEKASIAKLKSRKDRLDGHDRMTLINYEFERFYLFWLSILWRASISSLHAFRSVDLPEDLVEICRKTLITGKISNPLLPDMLQIGILRLALPPTLGDDREIMTSFMVHQSERVAGFSLIIAGFAVVYSMSSSEAEPLPEGFAKIKKSFSLKIKKVAPSQSALLAEIFTRIATTAQDHRP